MQDDEDDENYDYQGSRDSEGKYHGRGTLREGKGTMYFEEDDESLSGVWKSGSLHGPAVYTFVDGSTLGNVFHSFIPIDVFQVGTYIEGELQGTAREYTPNGLLRYEGEYENNCKHGRGRLFFDPVPSSGYIEGNWKEGVLEGQATYYYPFGGFYLKGTWKNGDMECAKFYLPDSKSGGKETYSFDPSTEKRISKSPMKPDPYEQQLVYVKKSTVAGEGLFAKIDLPAGVIVAFYNGIRVTHKEVDSRDWNDNDNTISLDEETVLDVPAEWSSCSKYCATLGHKANHSFENNAKYDRCFHPRFGNIKCIRTIRDVRKDEEIFADYGYTTTYPEWYRNAKKRKHED